jgi:7-keto-8-aminopelargonate synthetase-like enzyme
MNVMLLVHRSDRKGTLEAKGVMGVDIITGTLGKLGGAMGGYTTAKRSY